MSTRSIIAISNDDIFRNIYCHFDGYVEYLGITLNTYYNNPTKVDELIALGDISILSKFISPTHKALSEGGKEQEHSFEKQLTDVTVAYHRDRGEPLRINECQTFRSLLDDAISCSAEFVYLFIGNKWYVFDLYGKKNEWLSISEYLKQLFASEQ